MNIESDVAGSVIHVHVSVGDVIEAGASVASIESMKMEIPITTSTAGTVESISVEPGQAVSRGDCVAVLRDE